VTGLPDLFEMLGLNQENVEQTDNSMEQQAPQIKINAVLVLSSECPTHSGV